MDDDKKCAIIVSEPWDFESLDGKNIIKGIILTIVNNSVLVFETDHILTFDGVSGNILILSPRLKDHDFENITTKELDVNGGLLLIDYNSELKDSELKDNCKFVMIGALTSI